MDPPAPTSVPEQSEMIIRGEAPGLEREARVGAPDADLDCCRRAAAWHLSGGTLFKRWCVRLCRAPGPSFGHARS